MSKRIHISLEEKVEVITVVPEELDSQLGEEVTDFSDLQIQQGQDGLVSDIKDLDRAEDISEALEDLAMIASNIDEMTPERIALFQTAANMAVAGTDMDAAAILPSMEALKDKALALEGFFDTIKTVLSNIGKAIMALIEKIIDFVKGIFSATARYATKLKNLKEKIKELAKQNPLPKEKEIAIVGAPLSISIDSKAPKTFEEYMGNFDATAKYLKEFPSIQTAFILGYFKVSTEVGNIVSRKGEQGGQYHALCFVNNFYANGDLAKYRDHMKLTKEVKNLDPKLISASTEEMLGGRYFVGTFPKEHMPISVSTDKNEYSEIMGADILEKVKAYNFYFDDVEMKVDYSQGKVTPAKIDDLENVVKTSEHLIKLMDDANKFSKTDLVKANDSLKKVLSVISFLSGTAKNTKDVGNLSKTEKDNKATPALLKAVLHTTKISSSLTSLPNSYILNVIRGAIFMVEKQIDNFVQNKDGSFAVSDAKMISA